MAALELSTTSSLPRCLRRLTLHPRRRCLTPALSPHGAGCHHASAAAFAQSASLPPSPSIPSETSATAPRGRILSGGMESQTLACPRSVGLSMVAWWSSPRTTLHPRAWRHEQSTYGTQDLSSVSLYAASVILSPCY
jgi:hypothetical protein